MILFNNSRYVIINNDLLVSILFPLWEIRDIREGICSHYYFGCFSIQFLSGVAVTICSGHHYLFWPSLFVLAVTICLQKLNGESAQMNNDNICLPLSPLFLICFSKGGHENFAKFSYRNFAKFLKQFWEISRNLVKQNFAKFHEIKKNILRNFGKFQQNHFAK